MKGELGGDCRLMPRWARSSPLLSDHWPQPLWLGDRSRPGQHLPVCWAPSLCQPLVAGKPLSPELQAQEGVTVPSPTPGQKRYRAPEDQQRVGAETGGLY